MHTGKYVFAQVISVLNPNDFKKCVDKHRGNFKVKNFTCWHQLLCMMFGQLANRESLSDLILCLQSQKNKWYHLGIGTSISKSNLAHANEKRSWKIFADFAYMLIAEARNCILPNPDLKEFENYGLYAIDTTTIDLCLDVFWWAKFRKHKAAIRLHTLLDIKSEIPCYINITDGKTHELNVLDLIEFEPLGIYIMDRAFIDFSRLNSIHQQLAFFITRAKTNMKFKRVYSAKVNKDDGVMVDQTIPIGKPLCRQRIPRKV